MGYFRFYRIQDPYVEYLHKWDSRVQLNKGERRPYIGIVLTVNGFNYFVPLESPKENHVNIKSGGPVLKLDGGKLGIMGFNNMIPVKRNQLINFDIADEQEKQYQMLLLNQLHYCAKHKDTILLRAQNTYAKAVGGDNPFYKRVCCDFRKLENACWRYNPNRKHSKKNT